MQSIEYGNRKIIHVDMDAYYASIEMLDNPALKNLPVIVGGSPQSRGVVCTANYNARRFGVRSAMACSVAARLCPQAIFLPPRFDRYKEISLKIRNVFAQYTDMIEPLSLDEAYLDVTESKLGLFASQIAKRIQHEVLATTGLSCSAGVAPNKLVAKIASDFKKPAGLTVIPPEHVAAFMQNLPVRKIHGVGPATEKRLERLGIRVCADLRSVDMSTLENTIGSWASWLKSAAYGLDFRTVESKRERKSYGRETTFARDICDIKELESELADLLQHTIIDLKNKNLKPRTITLKVRYHNFERVTRSYSPGHLLEDSEEMMTILQRLLREKTDAGQRPMRLIGLSLSRFAS